MTKSAYVWRRQDDGDWIAVLIANLNKGEVSEDELDYQLGEIVYKDNLFVHKRVETDFMPKEYLEEIFAKYTKTRISIMQCCLGQSLSTSPKFNFLFIISNSTLKSPTL